MSEVLGTAASIIALLDAIMKLKKFALDFKNAPRNLQEYLRHLEIIVKLHDIIANIARESEQVRGLPVTINGKQMSLINHCLENVANTAENAKRLLQDFNIINDSTIQTLIQKLRYYIDRSRFALTQDNVAQFIQAVKQAEQSLHTALLTIQLQNSNLQQDIVQKLIQQNNEQLQAISASFNNIRERCERPKRELAHATVQRRHRIHKGRTQSKRINFTDSQGCVQQQLGTESSVQYGDVNNMERPEQGERSCTLVDTNFEKVGESGRNNQLVSIESEVESDEDVAVILTSEGQVVVTKDHLLNNEEIAIDERQLMALEPEPVRSLAEANHGISDDEWQQLTSSDSDASEVASTMDFGSDYAPESLYDTMTVHIIPNADVFLDRTLNIQSCTSDSNSCLSFCVHTIIINEHGVATLMLKEPCKVDSCEHVVLDMLPGMAIEKALPLSCQVLLQFGYTRTTADTEEESDSELFSFTVLKDGKTRCNQTMTIMAITKERPSSHPTVQSRISIREILRFYDDSDTTVDDDENVTTTSTHTVNADTSEGRNERDEQDCKPSSETADQDSMQPGEKRHSLGTYSTVPCFWCKKDAHRPEFNTSSFSGWPFWREDSFRYKCNECNRRTWVRVRGVGWGIGVPGGNWWLEGGFQ